MIANEHILFVPMFQTPSLAKRVTRRKILQYGINLGALTLAGLGYAHCIEPDWIEVVSIELVLPHLPQSFNGFRIAHISDIHIEGGNMRSRFSDIADLVTSKGADCIVMTGDYITAPITWQEEYLIRGFERLSAPYGVFAVLGNHDHKKIDESASRASIIKHAMAQAGVIELGNANHKLERNGEILWVSGVDDIGSSNADLQALLEELPLNTAAILLGHQPDHADEVAKCKRFDLMLSGHSHGGQIVLPFWGPIRVPMGSKKYPRGLYKIEDLYLYTNRGLGTVHLPIRIGSRPEITLFTLHSPLV